MIPITCPLSNTHQPQEFLIRYFPFDRDPAHYEMKLGVRAGIDAVIEIDEVRYREELKLKHEILASDYQYYFWCPPEAEAMTWDAIGLLLPQMAEQAPGLFSLVQEGDRWTWGNRLLGSSTTFITGDSTTLPLPPLDWLGRQVQEDLVLMAEASDGQTRCAAGHLCFASQWCLRDKMGLTLREIHGPVPEYFERIADPADRMLRGLKVGRPTGRVNWTVSSTAQLNLAPILFADWSRTRTGITVENAGERCFLRLERQTFSRLPRTRGILFTIHTYLHPMREVAEQPDRRRRFAAVLREMPPATVRYKGMESYIDALIQYLTLPHSTSIGLTGFDRPVRKG